MAASVTPVSGDLAAAETKAKARRVRRQRAGARQSEFLWNSWAGCWHGWTETWEALSLQEQQAEQIPSNSPTDALLHELDPLAVQDFDDKEAQYERTQCRSPTVDAGSHLRRQVVDAMSEAMEKLKQERDAAIEKLQQLQKGELADMVACVTQLTSERDEARQVAEILDRHCRMQKENEVVTKQQKQHKETTAKTEASVMRRSADAARKESPVAMKKEIATRLADMSELKFTAAGEPRRPMTAYFMFANANKDKIDLQSLQKVWHDLRDEDRNLYESFATSAMEKYQAELARRRSESHFR